MLRTILRAGFTAAFAAVFAFQAGPASAQTTSWVDPSGDTNNRGLFDISRVTVTNSSKKIVVKFRFPKATSLYPMGSYSVYIDTDKKKRGPEYVWGLGIPGESAFSTMRNNKFVKTWAGIVTDKKCGKTVRERFDLEAGVASISVTTKKGCLGKPKRVRTNIHTQVYGEVDSDFDYDTSVQYEKTESDFYPAKKKYSPWVVR